MYPAVLLIFHLLKREQNYGERSDGLNTTPISMHEVSAQVGAETVSVFSSTK
jgi:hypothetical protein